MGMTAAFDASGDEASQLVVVVAGFISSADDWEVFSKQWDSRLHHDGLEYMHMREFAHSVGQFATGWKGEKTRRDTLLFDLMNIIKSNAYRKFGIVVFNETLKQNVSPKTLEEWHLNAYSFAGRSCSKQVNEWAAVEAPWAPVDLVFEEGDAGAGKLHARLLEDGCQPPIFRPKRDRVTPEGVTVPAFVPLQAADFLAYELFLEVTRMDERQRKYPQRWPFIQFDRMLGYIGTYTVEDLKQFQLMVDVTKTLDDWAVSLGLLKRDSAGRLCREIPSVKLAFFTWGFVNSPSGVPMVAPVCTAHPNSRINVNKTGNDISIVCNREAGQHVLGACSFDEFEAEGKRATEILESRGGTIKVGGQANADSNGGLETNNL